jgi:hypothetical protein
MLTMAERSRVCAPKSEGAIRKGEEVVSEDENQSKEVFLVSF